jgi:hypothetical protein
MAIRSAPSVLVSATTSDPINGFKGRVEITLAPYKKPPSGGFLLAYLLSDIQSQAGQALSVQG